ncbi:MAG: PaaI family thioesterase [Vicinamibacteria bacterium]
MEERIRSSFARQDFMQMLGASLESVASGAVEVRLPVRPGLFQQHGFVHAGAVSAIADTAAGYAAMTLVPDGTEVLTAEFKINLLAPAKGDHLVARARVVRSGRRLTVSSCDVFSVAGSAETCVATMLATIAHR